MLINCRGILLDLSQPKVMGILNVTPDSFFDGKKVLNDDIITQQIEQLILSEVDIIDIGGMSSRPGAKLINADVEWNRIKFAISYIRTNYPQSIISVDTIHSKVAEQALQIGCHMINDISGGHLDSNMLSVVGQYKAPFILMHMRSTPESMEKDTNYPDGVTLGIMKYLKAQILVAERAGIQDIIIDPGFGFSKTLDQNYELMNKLHTLTIYDRPILVGVSRKSLIYKVLGSSPKDALNGTTALHMKALLEGAKILRVHDVKEAKETIEIFSKLELDKK